MTAAPPETIPGVLASASERWPDSTALVDGEQTWTFAALAGEVHRAAAALAASGVTRGVRVAIWAPNGADWVVAALAVACAGGVLVPVNTRARGPEAADIIERSCAELLLTVPSFLGSDHLAMLGAVDATYRDLREVVLLGSDSVPAIDAPGRAALVPWADLVVRGAGTSVAAVEPDDVSHVQFTSGTTGRPKGAMLRHRAMCGTTRDWCRSVGLEGEDRYLIVSPMFHVSGHKTGMLACLTSGATMLPQRVFDPVVVMRRVQDERVTVLPGPPTIYQALLDHPQRGDFDLSSLKLAVTGAAAIPPVLVERMRRELGFTRVVTAYGTTETTGVVTMCDAADDVETIASTSGRPVPGVDVRIDGDTSEILVRGYTVMAGYLDDPAATADAIDESGWFHTGDVGSFDEHGNLRITDRLTDVFHVGGFNTYPAEIEAAMLRHHGVRQVAVIGVPDQRLGEVGHAFVVRRPGVDLDEATLLDWCREQMANYKVPRGITFVEELPVTASGKVQKFALLAGRSAPAGADEPVRTAEGTGQGDVS